MRRLYRPPVEKSVFALNGCLRYAVRDAVYYFADYLVQFFRYFHLSQPPDNLRNVF